MLNISEALKRQGSGRLERPDRLTAFGRQRPALLWREPQGPTGSGLTFLPSPARASTGSRATWGTPSLEAPLRSGEEEKKRLLSSVGSRLLERQYEDGGWGYGPGVPSDADSTSWCLLFLSRLGTQGAESRERASRFLLRHQSPLDGGFRTYATPSEVGRYMMLDASVSFRRLVLFPDVRHAGCRPGAGRGRLHLGRRQGPGATSGGARPRRATGSPTGGARGSTRPSTAWSS